MNEVWYIYTALQFLINYC